MVKDSPGTFLTRWLRKGHLDVSWSWSLVLQAAVAAVYVGAVVWGGYAALHTLQGNLVAQRSLHLARTAASMAQALEAFLFERVNELQQLSHYPEIRHGAPDQHRRILRQYLRTSTFFESARVIDAQGVTTAATLPSSQAATDPRWIQEIQRTEQTRLLSSRTAGDPALTLALPVRFSDGQGVGVLSGTIPLDTVHSMLQRRFALLTPELNARDWLLLDPQGIVVTDRDRRRMPTPDLRRQAQPSAPPPGGPSEHIGFFEERDRHTQVTVVTGFARLSRQPMGPDFSWTVQVRAPRDSIYGPINRFLWVIGALFALAAGVLAYVGLELCRSLVGEEEYPPDQRFVRGPAYYDTVTGLPGIRLFEMILGQAIARRVSARRLMALILFDLHQLKVVSDCQGHARGDLAVRVLAARVKSCVRMSDAVARVGGARFAVLLENLPSPEDAATVAQKILQTVVLPLTLGDEEILIDTSMGIALYPDDAPDAKGLMERAVQAMSRATAEGVPIGFHSATLGEQVFERVARTTTQAAPPAPSSRP